MNQLKVSKQCNGCGLCVQNCLYLAENAEGNAVAKEGMSIREEDLKTINELIKNCPEKALSIVEISSTSQKGKEGLYDLKQVMSKKISELNLKRASKSDISFNASEYEIAIPYSSKQYCSIYNSESQAKSAARDEFERLCYSPSAYRPILKKIFVEYKLRKLKPYYGCSSGDNNIYHSLNCTIETFLKNIYAEAKDLNGGQIPLPESWCKFDVYLTQKDWQIEMLSNYEENSTCSGIIDEFKSSGQYTSLSWYVDQMDYDYEEVYDGEGVFGRSRYKNKWNFSGFEASAKEFVSDLKSAMNSVSGDIEERVVDVINSAIDTYETKAKAEFTKKLQGFCIAFNL